MVRTNVKYMISNKEETRFLTDPVAKSFSKYRENAYEWDTEKSAQFVADKLPNAKVMKSLSYMADVDECLMMDTETIQNFLDIVKESRATVTDLEQRLDILNRQIVDIEHFIQFKDLNVPSGFKAYKLLQTKRRERGYIKGKLRIARDINSLKIDEGTLEALVRLFKSELIYKPRELNFEDMI